MELKDIGESFVWKVERFLQVGLGVFSEINFCSFPKFIFDHFNPRIIYPYSMVTRFIGLLVILLVGLFRL